MTSLSKQAEAAKKAAIAKKKRELERLRYELPHRYGFKWYKWAWDYYNSTNRMTLLCAANQISKSSTAIRRHVERATNKELWSKLWPDKNGIPNIPRQFWYLYPSAQISSVEFQHKWIPEFMPKMGKVSLERGKEKCEHPVYGWKANYDKKMIYSIDWASGITTYFKTYAQNVHTLQSSSPHVVDCDEELPESLYDELMFRLTNTEGYFGMVFTATRNQLMWLLAMEGKGDMEKFPDAFKQQVTMYDCRFYMDGSPGAYHDEKKIQAAIDKCKDEAEVQRRVFGKFVADKGRKYPKFDPKKHYVKPFEIPKDWHFYGGVDPGSGGKSGHPTGMGILAVNPDFTKGYVIDGWRGDKIETTSGDALIRFLDLRGNRRLVWQVGDQAAVDFFRIAERMGESFIKAEKSHEIGEQVVNTLFANDALFIFDKPELQSLGHELLTLMSTTHKRDAKDDFIDGALRYPCALIPWDWTNIEKVEKKEEPIEHGQRKKWTDKEWAAWEIEQRRGDLGNPKKRHDKNDSWEEFDQECDFWNDQYGQ